MNYLCRYLGFGFTNVQKYIQLFVITNLLCSSADRLGILLELLLYKIYTSYYCYGIKNNCLYLQIYLKSMNYNFFVLEYVL